MAIPSRAELLQLDVASRLELIEELWDSIASDPSSAAQLPVTDEEQALLEERLAKYRANPTSARPWSEVLDELRRSRC